MDDIAKTIAETLRDPKKVAVISKNLVDLGALFERAAESIQALAREVEKMGEAAAETAAETTAEPEPSPPPNHYCVGIRKAPPAWRAPCGWGSADVSAMSCPKCGGDVAHRQGPITGPSSKRRKGAPVDLATRYKKGEDVVGDIASVLAVRTGLQNEIRRISGGDAIRIGKGEATVCFWRKHGKFIAHVEPDTNLFDKIDMAMRAMGFEHN